MLESLKATSVFETALDRIGLIECHLRENLERIPDGNVVWATVRDEPMPILVEGTKEVEGIRLGTTDEVCDAIREKPNHLFVLVRHPSDIQDLPEAVSRDHDSPAARFSAVVDPMLEEQSSSLIVCVVE